MSGRVSLTILSLVLPMFLIPVEAALPYPAIIEEVTKLIVIAWWMGSVKTKKDDWKYPAMAGIMFAVCETVLYINKILMTGSWWLVPTRLVVTALLHSLTMVILFKGIEQKKALLGLVIAMFIHWMFNLAV